VAGAVCGRRGPCCRTFLTFVVALPALTRIEPTRIGCLTSFWAINAATIPGWSALSAPRSLEGGFRPPTARPGRAAKAPCPDRQPVSRLLRCLPAVVGGDRRQCDDRPRVRTGCFSGPNPARVIQNSLIVARGLQCRKHAQLIRGDILGMANDIAHARAAVRTRIGRTFRELLSSSAAFAEPAGAPMVDRQGSQYSGDRANRHSTGLHHGPAPEFLSKRQRNRGRR